MKRIDPIEDFTGWAIDAPINEVSEMCERLRLIIRMRLRPEAPLSVEPRLGRPKGSKNKPREVSNGSQAIGTTTAAD